MILQTSLRYESPQLSIYNHTQDECSGSQDEIFQHKVCQVSTLMRFRVDEPPDRSTDAKPSKKVKPHQWDRLDEGVLWLAGWAT
jgi:hypothetical protein